MTYMKNYDINSENYASYIEQAKTRSELDEHKMNKGVISGLIPVDASSQFEKIEPEPLYSIFSKRFPRPYNFSSPPSYPLWLASKLEECWKPGSSSIWPMMQSLQDLSQ